MKLAEILSPLNAPVVEAAVRAYKRTGTKIKRYFRCTSGRKQGKLVSKPQICALRKDPRKVRVGKRVARTKKGIRIRKSKVARRTAASKLTISMNQRISNRIPKIKFSNNQ